MTTAELRLSVVIPTFNRAEKLERVLQAIRGQVAAPRFEVIVVDDGSMDRTPEVLATHPWVRSIRLTNGGPARARNAGWRAAHAEVVVFTDDDVVPSRLWLAELDQAFRATDAVAIGGTIRSLSRGFIEDFVTAERLVDHGRDDLQVRFLVTANMAIARSALAELGGFDETFPLAAGEDTDLSFRLRKRGFRLAVSAQALVLHDHRTAVGALLRTYHRHGIARAHLGRLHPDFGLGAQTRSMFGPGYWIGRYRWYRGGEHTPARALCYCVIRACGLFAYAAGLVRGSRSPWKWE